MSIPFSFEARERNTLDVHIVVNDESGKAPVELVPCRKYQGNTGIHSRMFRINLPRKALKGHANQVQFTIQSIEEAAVPP
jgi:hypothetical protein